MVISDSGWENFISTDYIGDWAQYDPSILVSYRKIGDIVFLRGLVKNAGAATSSILTLPSSIRPIGI